MDTLVVGAGAMGRWLAETLPADALTVVDSDPATAGAAAEALDADVLAATSDATFDLVAVAVPIPAAAEAIAAHADRLRADGTLVDVVGVMAEPVAAGREHALDAERLSLHPLFAPERAPGRIAAVPDAPGSGTAAVRRALERAGNEVFETTAGTHDRAMETVQARAHAAVLAFGLAAEPVPEAFATPVFERLAAATETVTGNDPRVYADVQDALDGAGSVAEAARRVADWDGDREAFAALYDEAGGRLLEDDPLDGGRDGPGDTR